MRISKLLAEKGSKVETIRPDTTVRQGVSELVRHGVGALVVSEDGRSIDGIVSERDIVRGLERDDGALLDEPVSSIMSTTVHTCGPEDDTSQLMSTMTDRRIRHVPIVADGELVGIISIGDVVKTTIGELEKDRKELEQYITAR